jgi:hypothetical protein
MDRRAEEEVMFRFWNALEEAYFRRRSPQDSPIDRLLKRPWESTDPLVQKAWKAITHPMNLKRLEIWLRPGMNPEARKSTEMAIADCRRRMKENPTEEPPLIPDLPECMR